MMYGYPQYQQFPQYQQQYQQPAQKCEVIRVNGEAGARAYQMQSNSSVLLLDQSAPIVWLAQTDGAGYKTVTPYSITPYQPAPEVNVNALEARIKRLEDVINGQSNSRGDEQPETSK